MKYILLFLTVFTCKTQSFAFVGEKDSISSITLPTAQSACATVNVPLTATYCNGDVVPASVFTSIPAGATFDWTNNNVAIGLPASGTGNIASFPAVNLSVNTPIVAVITVTPKIGACTGIASNFIITINPTPSATLLPLTQTDYCFGDTVKMTVNLTGKLPLAFYMNNNTRLYASPTYTRIITETNVGVHSYFFSGTDYVYDTKACQNTVSGGVNFIIRPLPTAAVSANDSACLGATKNIRIDLTGTAPWYITYDSAGLSPITIKRYSSPVYIPVSTLGTWTYTVKQIADSFCSKTTTNTVTIKIKPLPTMVATSNQTVCGGSTAAATTFSSLPSGSTFTWTNSNTSIGLGASGSGSVPSFGAINLGPGIISGNINVTPTLLGCAGTPAAFSITVNPMPSVSVPSAQSYCHGETITASSFTSIPAGATYTWTNSNTAIGLGASGSGNVPSFIATNSSTTAITATITVLPSLGICSGTSNTYTINLKPTPALSVTPNQNVCEGATVGITNFTSTPPGASFTWTNTNTTIGLAAAGANSIPSFVALNGSGAILSSTVNVGLSLAGCAGTTAAYTIDVKPKPIAIVPSNQNVCTGATVNASTYTSTPAGASFTWTNSNTAIGLSASGSGNIPAFTSTNASGSTLTGNIEVLASLNGCVGDVSSYSLSVSPKPTVAVPANFSVCDMESVVATSLSSLPAGATYTWTNSNPSIGLAASGNGDIPAFTATNASTSSITANLIVTPTINGCAGVSSSYTITVKARPMAIVPANQSICAGATLAASNYSSSPAGASFGWANSDPSIGLAFSGSNNLPAFVAQNAGSSTVTAQIDVVAILNGCMGPNVPYTITVKPKPIVNVLSNQTVCAGASVLATGFSSVPAGSTYAWNNSNSAIGLSLSGTGNVPSFVASNSGSTTLSGTVSAIPTLNGCIGDASVYTINVNPTPAVSAVASQTLCDGATTSPTNFTSVPAGATFSWSNTNPSIGLAANGNGNIASFTATNAGSTVVVSSISVVPTLAGCIGTSQNYNLTVNPKPTVTAPANQSLCTGAIVGASNFVSLPSGATYSWTNSNSTIGLAASGVGNVPAFTATNPGTAGISGTITITPTLNSCIGNSSTFTISVDAKPSVSVPGNQIVCDGASIVSSNFSSVPAGAIYSWTNSQPAIGIGASGNGDVPSFTAINSGTAVVNANITVTPNLGGCAGNPVSYTLQINPKPQVLAPSNQVVCAATSIPANILVSTPPGASFTWTNSNTSIGLIASDVGNVPAFVAQNSGSTVLTSLITLSPTLSGCAGAPVTYSIAVNPIPSLSPLASQVECDGALVGSSSFSSLPAGASFTWTNSLPTIGLGANGNGSVPAFTASNSGSSTLVALLSVTPTLNGCSGNPVNYTVTVKPKPSVVVPSNFSVCDGTPVATSVLTSSPAGASFTWTNTSTLTGLPASGIGDIPAFTASNSGTTVLTSTLTLVPTLGGCLGNSGSYSIQVNPTPSFVVPSNQSVCGGVAIAATALTSTPSGAIFNWTNSATSIGLAATGTGNVPAFTAQNFGSSPVNGIITITPSLNGCSGNAASYTLSINPQPTATVPSNQVVCDGGSLTSSSFSSVPPGATFSWLNNNTSIGLNASGSSDVPAFTAINAGSTVQTANISVIPAIGGCSGNASLYTITVQPKPSFTAPLNQIICSGSTVAASNLVSIPVGAGYSWSNNNTLIGLGASGTGNIPSFTANNLGTTAQSATVTISPSMNGCTGNASSYTVTVNPLPTVQASSNTTVCEGAVVAVNNLSSIPAGASYTWTNSAPSIGLASSGNGNIPSFTALNGSSSVLTASISITPSLNGCMGPLSTYSINSNPLPVAQVPAAQVVCSGATVPISSFSSIPTGATYSWNNSNTLIGLAAGGSGNVPSFISTNTSNGSIAGTITVTPSLNSCSGNPATYTISVNPVATLSVPAPQSVCSGTTLAAINLLSNPSGAQFSWSNSNPAIGLAANGTGVVPAFTATNSNLLPQSGTITVSPTYNGCLGTSSSFSIEVKPIPSINLQANQVVCDGATVAASNFSSNLTAATFTWTNTNTAVGIGASGTGNIPSFIASNTTVAPISASFDVTASFDGCTSTAATNTLTVNPRPILLALSNQTACAGAALPAVNFTSSTSGTTFTWTNSTTGLGLAASGSGSIAGFTAVNSGTAPLIANIVATPVFQGCIGTTGSYSITVNPLPVMNAVANQSICAGSQTAPINFTASVSGSTYSWTNSVIQIGLTASGTGDIAPFAIQNPTSSVVSSNLVVVPSANGCAGAPGIFTLTATPAPKINSIANKNACVGSTIAAINFSSVPLGANYSWTNTISDIGLATAGTGNINSFVAGNSTTATHIATITVTPILNGCVGTDTNFTVTVPPQAIVAVPSDTVVCGGSPLPATLFAAIPATATFSWTSSNATIGLPLVGTTFVPTFTPTNVSGSPLSTTITVTPSEQGCVGIAKSYKIVVNSLPLSNFTFTPEDATILFPSISFSNQSQFAVSNNWDFADGGFSGDSDPRHDFLDTGCYQVKLVSISAEGCRDSIFKEVCIETEFHVYLPNAFTPNGDGLNDTFAPVGMGITPFEYEMSIYNRKSTQIFSSTVLEQGWDGRSNLLMIDDKSPMDTYVYRIRCKDVKGKFHFFTGQVNLIR